jgi:hypothetical protein
MAAGIDAERRLLGDTSAPSARPAGEQPRVAIREG